ncbi:MAG: PAS domain S-box protein, partial [Proteobacteria bacterium]|nr:PAS domain S-box protein [Pseudomonadota bacterium]
HPDDLEASLVHFNRLLSGAIDEFSLRKRFLHKDGSIVWMEVSIGCVRRADGTVDYVLALLVDITKRKQTEDQLRESETRFRIFFENAPAPYQSMNAEGCLLEVNKAWLEMTGYHHEEVIGRSIAEFFTPASLPRLKECFPVFLQNGFVHNAEFDFVGKKGEIITVVVEGRISCHSDGTFKQAHCVLHNISERKQAEQALQESEERYRTLVNNLPGVAYRCLNDEHWTMVFFSAGIERMTGYPATDFIDNAVRSYTSIIYPEDCGLVDRAVQEGVNVHKPFEMEYRLLRADNTMLWVYERGQGIFDAAGKLLWLDGVIIDISEQRRAQEEKERLQVQLLQAQKMELVGILAGGVAHDFNNMLQAILGYSDLSLAQIEETSPVHEGLLEIRKAAMRSADLTRQLLAFARKQTINPKILDLNDTVVGMLKMLQRLIGENIDLAWLPGHDLWPVKMDPSQLDQILVNLMVNARDAIADTGKITIETKKISLDMAYCADHPGFRPGEYVLLTVSDNGCGMNKEMLPKIFEPFFTTKEKGKGTGLGLSTVYGIVKQNNGFVYVYSEPGQGTTFSIYLPSFSTAMVKIETPLTEATVGGTETILLVEDEAVLLNLAETILQRLGYTVLTVNSPMAALQLVQEHPGKIDLLITDLVMPGMNGRELAQRLSSLRPAMHCLYMSGYTADVIAHHGVLDTGVHFIQKPFSIDNLARAIREALCDITKNP